MTLAQGSTYDAPDDAIFVEVKFIEGVHNFLALQTVSVDDVYVLNQLIHRQVPIPW